MAHILEAACHVCSTAEPTRLLEESIKIRDYFGMTSQGQNTLNDLCASFQLIILPPKLQTGFAVPRMSLL